MASDTAVFGLGTIGQISMRATDLPRAVTFYRDMLGVRHLFDAGPDLSFFDCGGVRLMLSKPEKDFDHPGSVLYFRVDDIHAACRAAAWSSSMHRISSPVSPITSSGCRSCMTRRGTPWH
jgi:predicted enzyme related to lactoylglutathione lyase